MTLSAGTAWTHRRSLVFDADSIVLTDWVTQTARRENIVETGDIKTWDLSFPQVHVLLLTHAHTFAKFYQNTITSRGFIQNQHRVFLTLIGGGVYETDLNSLTHNPSFASSAQKETVSPARQKSVICAQLWNHWQNATRGSGRPPKEGCSTWGAICPEILQIAFQQGQRSTAMEPDTTLALWNVE